MIRTMIVMVVIVIRSSLRNLGPKVKKASCLEFMMQRRLRMTYRAIGLSGLPRQAEESA